jgi:hypothetical protein
MREWEGWRVRKGERSKREIEKERERERERVGGREMEKSCIKKQQPFILQGCSCS